MDDPTNFTSLIKVQKLSHNIEYYNNVFKKTERVVSAIFHVLSYVEDNWHHRIHTDSVTLRAQGLYETAWQSLAIPAAEAPERLETLQLALIALGGALEMAKAGRVLAPALLLPLEAELDLIVRYLRNHYFAPDAAVARPVHRPLSPRPASPSRRRALTRAVIPAGDISSEAPLVYTALTDRAERIQTVLEAKPSATIKDITDVITDVGEKTIQRELNSLIEKGQVIREGQRRWSRYSVKR
jgi:DNA-binding transcriptional ArsR family regulator